MNFIHKQLFDTQKEQNIWVFNINEEQRWSSSREFPSVSDHDQMELVQQQEQQMLFLAKPNDTIVWSRYPDEGFLRYIKKQGVTIPNIEILDGSREFIGEHQDEMIIPYVLTEEFDHVFERCFFKSPPELVKNLNNKFITRQLAQSNNFRVTTGFICKTIEQLQQCYEKLTQIGFSKCVIKIPHGSSGKGLRVIDNYTFFKIFLKYIGRRSNDFEFLLEGWHPVKQHINAQLLIQEHKIEILYVSEQRIDVNGVYRGTNYVPAFEARIIEKYQDEMLRLGAILQKSGYRGICGVDSFIDEQGVLYPIIEINARFTQVTYLLSLIQKFSEQSKLMESRFIRFESIVDYNFGEIEEILNRCLEPNETNHYFVYTFAKKRIEQKGKTIYRIFVMFYGNDEGKIQNMIEAFIKLEQQGELLQQNK
jgi:hypothetical protein